MKKILICLFIFSLSIATGVIIYKNTSKKFYSVSSKQELTFSKPIQQKKVRIKSCVEEETNIGEVFLGKFLQKGFAYDTQFCYHNSK